jgi:hypothetical protein
MGALALSINFRNSEDVEGAIRCPKFNIPSADELLLICLLVLASLGGDAGAGAGVADRAALTVENGTLDKAPMVVLLVRLPL